MNLISVLSAAIGYTIRDETFNGRQCLVVPMVILVEGVHHGSGGPLYYPAEELAEFVGAWNGIPVVVPHPTDEHGNPISANWPEVLEGYSVGRVFNSEFDESGNKLRAEAWIDVETAEAIRPDILAIVRSGARLEVSTGMYFENDGVSGTWNGEDFDGTVRNYRPDHLALLPGQRGACSWTDGCGVRANANNQGGTMTVNINGSTAVPVAAAGVDPVPACAACAENAKPKSIKDQVMNALRAIKALGQPFTINADISHDSIRGKLQTIINGLDNEQWINWVRAVFDNYFIYEARGHNPATGGYTYHLYKRDYTLNDTGVVTLGESVTEVIEETIYTPVPEMAANKGKEKQVMNKAKIDALIANAATRFAECDREWLGAQSEETLDKLAPVEAPAPAPAANVEKPKPVANTAEEYVAQAPEAYKPLLTNALARENAAKKALVDGLIANARNKFTREQLEAKSTTELEQLAELGAVEVNFEGKSGGPIVNTDAGEVLSAPRLFESKAA